MESFIWVEFEGLLIGDTDKAARFAGPRVANAMAPFEIPKRCLRRIMYADGTWSKSVRSGAPVCAFETTEGIARQKGLA